MGRRGPLELSLPGSLTATVWAWGEGGAGEARGDEAELVHAAQEDPAAFGVLYQRYRHRVYAYLRARITTTDDAADLTQHVFVRALDALPRYHVRRTPFAAWLFRIAHNAATDFQRRQRHTVSWDLLPDLLHPVAAQTPETHWLQAEELQRLRGLLAALDPDTRHLLALRFAAGLTIPEIAAVLHKSEAATQKKLFRTIHTLQEQYHDAAR